MYISNLKEAINSIEQEFKTKIAALDKSVSLAQEIMNRMVSTHSADIENINLMKQTSFLKLKRKMSGN